MRASDAAQVRSTALVSANSGVLPTTVVLFAKLNVRHVASVIGELSINGDSGTRRRHSVRQRPAANRGELGGDLQLHEPATP